jgi:2-keto-4-pentenoate hydratase/2-oxohepta-3-ene-1,7-dioic acid hydratase in catechol pathway
MERIYRIVKGGEVAYVAEYDGQIHRLALRGRDLFAGYDRADPLIGGLAGAIVLAPVRPQKFVCVGLNYKDHAAEMKKPLPAEPMLFFKPATAVLDPDAAILLPPGVGRVDHEAELAVVIGRRAHRVTRARAWDYVFGITAVNDVTARDMQNREIQYTRAKSFDTFAPIGPCIATLDSPASPGPLGVEGWVNDQCRQRSTTAQLIFPIDFLIEYISFVMTLEPGDVISTGTPAGVGPLVNGDVVTIKVEGVGALSNPVIDEA